MSHVMAIRDTCFTISFEDIMKDSSYRDVTIVGKNGTIKAHRVVLSLVSPFVASMLLNICPAIDCTLIFPDFNIEFLTKWISFMYTGTWDNFNDEDPTFEEFNKVINFDAPMEIIEMEVIDSSVSDNRTLADIPLCSEIDLTRGTSTSNSSTLPIIVDTYTIKVEDDESKMEAEEQETYDRLVAMSTEIRKELAEELEECEYVNPYLAGNKGPKYKLKKKRRKHNRNIDNVGEHSKTPKSLKCSNCNQEFTTNHTFKIHVKRCVCYHHTSNEFSHSSTSIGNDNSVDVIKSIGRKPSSLKCSHCHRIFTRDHTFKLHIESRRCFRDKIQNNVNSGNNEANGPIVKKKRGRPPLSRSPSRDIKMKREKKAYSSKSKPEDKMDDNNSVCNVNKEDTEVIKKKQGRSHISRSRSPSPEIETSFEKKIISLKEKLDDNANDCIELTKKKSGSTQICGGSSISDESQFFEKKLKKENVNETTKTSVGNDGHSSGTSLSDKSLKFEKKLQSSPNPSKSKLMDLTDDSDSDCSLEIVTKNHSEKSGVNYSSVGEPRKSVEEQVTPSKKYKVTKRSSISPLAIELEESSCNSIDDKVSAVSEKSKATLSDSDSAIRKPKSKVYKKFKSAPRSKSPQKIEVHKCTLCDEDFYSAIVLQQHLEGVHEVSYKIKEEIVSREGSPSVKKVLDDENSDQDDSEKRKSLPSKNLPEQEASCSGSDQKVAGAEDIPDDGLSEAGEFHCTFCPRRYRYEYPYIKHFITHVPMPFACLVCGKAYQIRKFLMEHVDSHYETNTNI